MPVDAILAELGYSLEDRVEPLKHKSDPRHASTYRGARRRACLRSGLKQIWGPRHFSDRHAKPGTEQWTIAPRRG